MQTLKDIFEAAEVTHPQPGQQLTAVELRRSYHSTPSVILVPSALMASINANQALLHSVRRLRPGQHFVGDQAFVVHSSLGIDTQPAGSTPGGEMVWVYVRTDNPETFCLLRLAAYLGIAQPLVEAAMQFVTVVKNGHQPVKVRPLVPSHADGLNVCGHSASRV